MGQHRIVVLAGIAAFLPALAAAADGIAVSPRYAALQPGQTMQLSVPASTGAVLWQVDGVIGGTAASGTISKYQ